MEDLRGKAGIYKIVNAINGKVYVGSSINLHNRKKNHFTTLNNGNHHNSHLQKAYNKYGKENFFFEIIEIVTKNENKNIFKENILKSEQYWIDRYNACNIKYGYNLAPKASSLLGYKKTPEQVKRGVTYGKFYGEGITASKVINLNTGKRYDSIKRAAEECGMRDTSNISCVCRGITETAGGYRWAYLDENDNIVNTNFEHKHNKIIINITTGEIFNSITIASRSYNVSVSAIMNVLSGRSKTCKGCIWKYVNNNLIHSKSKKVINLNDKNIFSSMNEAARFYNINSKGISYACKRKNNIYAGYHWQYCEDYLKEHPEGIE